MKYFLSVLLSLSGIISAAGLVRSPQNAAVSFACSLSSQVPIDFNTQFLPQVINDGPIPKAQRPYLAVITRLESYPTSWEGGSAPPDVSAFGAFDVEMGGEGWDYLWIASGTESSSDAEKAYGAGYLEGYITANQTYLSILNTGANSTWDAAIQSFLIENSQFLVGGIANFSAIDPYWYHTSLVLLQLQGLYDGYMDATPAAQHFGFRTFLNIQLSGDFDDLSAALGLQYYGRADAIPHPKSMHRHSQMARVNGKSEAEVRAAASRQIVDGHLLPTTDGNGHCSAVVKAMSGPDGNFSEIYIAQTSWSGFEDMLRIYKTYNLQFMLLNSDKEFVPGLVSSFSSYPGSIFSGDDWYTIQPTQLVVLETTIGNSNPTLYQDYIRPTSVMDWMRNILANRLAEDAPSWASTFSRYNSGTYNNEFFILDYKKFKPRTGKIAPNTFWVLDQIPGYINATDMSDVLNAQTYFASYNVPSYPFIYQMNGEQALAQQYGPWFSWNATARANIFRRDQVDAINETAFRHLIRYNDFQHDPLSTQGCSNNPPYSGENAIACRDDLNPSNGIYPIGALGHRDHAAIDVKYTAWKYMDPRNTTSMIQAGPTYDQQPPFAWSTTTPDIAALSHLGMPDSWTMPWLAVASKTF